jgi:hypothetical protein
MKWILIVLGTNIFSVFDTKEQCDRVAKHMLKSSMVEHVVCLEHK